MQFKTEEAERQYPMVKKRLRDLLTALDNYCKKQGLPEIVVTSLLRPDNPNSQHYLGEAADIRAKHLTAPQLAAMYRFTSEKFFRHELNGAGMQLRCFYPHGEGENFHVHISIDHLG